MINLAVLDLADRGDRFDRGADHKARGVGALAIRAEAATERRADQRTQDRIDAGATAAGLFGGFQFGEPLPIERQTARDEQFGDQFVFRTEMIIHRGEIDAGSSDDVAQRHVGEAAIGIKPLGGGKDRRSCVIRRHVMGPCNAGETGQLQFKQLYETMV